MHVQRCPVDPLFRHGEDEQISTEIVKIWSASLVCLQCIDELIGR